MKKIGMVIVCVTMMVVALATTNTAFAADYTENEAVAITAELIQTGHASTTGDRDKAVALKKEVQAYVDAVSATSETPIVGVTLSSSGNITLTLYEISDNYSTEEVVGLSNKAGDTVESISNWVCDKMDYDHAAAENSSTLSQKSSQLTAKGAVTTGKAVCQGYANTFTMLADNAGFQTIKVRGYVNGVYHVLNMVMTDGGLKVVDCVVNDSSNNRALLISLEDYIKMTGFTSIIDVQAAFALKYNTAA